MKNLFIVIVSLTTLVACSGIGFNSSLVYEDDYYGTDPRYYRVDTSLREEHYKNYYLDKASYRAKAGSDYRRVDRYRGYNNQGYSLHSGRYGSYSHSSRGYGGYRGFGGHRRYGTYGGNRYR